jgi:hypothetical protein
MFCNLRCSQEAELTTAATIILFYGEKIYESERMIRSVPGAFSSDSLV